MRKLPTRWNLILLLVALVTVSAVLLAGARHDELGPGAPAETHRPQPDVPFQQCPTPPCMAPCIFGAEPEVECLGSDGAVSETTYFCCCCGGGGGANQFRPL